MNWRILTAVIVFALSREYAHANPDYGIKASGAYGMQYSQAAAGWGVSYRINDNFYQQFIVDYSEYRSSCLYRRFHGGAIALTLFNNSNFALSFRYYKAIRRFYSHNVIPYWGVAPSYFQFSNVSGVNIRPQLGVKISPFYDMLQFIGFDFDISYGYDVPVISESSFAAGRHDLTATVLLTFEINDIWLWFHRKDAKRVDAQF